MSNIPAGYQIQVTSWENDGDNYNTKILSGLSKELAKFYSDFCKLFTKSHHEPGGIAGNAYKKSDVKWDSLFEKFKEIVGGFPGCFAEMGWEKVDLENESELRNAIGEIAYELMGGSEYFYFRKVETIEVFYIPQEIEQVTL